MKSRFAALLALAACDPYRAWPDATSVFPYVHTLESGLPPYAEVRVETETWDPLTDTETTALYLLKAAQHRPGAPVESIEHFAAMRAAIPPLGDGVRLSFVGDVMWVGENWAHFLDPAASLLDGDLRIGNLETPVSPSQSTEPLALGTYAFNAPPAMLDGLPLDVVQLNNNHSLDAGDLGLNETLAEVAARGFTATGVDTHAAVEVDGTKVAFLAYTWGLNVYPPTEHELFIVPFGHLDAPIDLERLESDVRAARADADAVVVLLHWGFEYEYYPDPHFLRLSRSIIAAGADVIVGSGPHVVQPPEWCAVNQPEIIPGIGTCSVRTDDGEPRDAAILYSLGNFGTKMGTVPCQVGLVATVSLDPHPTGLGWAAAASIDDGEREVVPLDQLLDRDDFAAEAERLDAHLGISWKR